MSTRGSSNLSKIVAVALLACMAFVMLAFPFPAAAQDSEPDPETWVANGAVRAVADAGSTAYIGGDFTYIGPNNGQGLPLDSSTGQPVADFPRVTGGTVWSCAPDGAGGWYVAGSFNRVGGVVRNRVARVKADGTVDPEFNPSPDNNVWNILYSNGTLYVGGEFQNIGGAKRGYLAALNGSTGHATNWNPGADKKVFALALYNGVLYVGGEFGKLGGKSRDFLGAVNASSGAVTSWDPDPDDLVNDITVSAFGDIYVCGKFTYFGVWPFGKSRHHIASVKPKGTIRDWNPGTNNEVQALITAGNTIYAGGEFTQAGGGNRNYAAAYDGSSGALTSWNPGPDNVVRNLATVGGNIYVAGDFINIGGSRRNYLACVSSSGAVTPFVADASDKVVALCTYGSKVFAGGYFTSIGGELRNHLASIDKTTGHGTSWNPDANGIVSALAVYGTTLYAGGSFTTVGGHARNRIAGIDAFTGDATAWNPDANSTVSVLELSPAGDTVYAGGAFTTIGGQLRNRIAALSSSTGDATSWSPDANDLVGALELSPAGDTVYAGGSFTTIGGQLRNRIAALSASTGDATAWNPDANNRVYALAVPATGDPIYAGGSFTDIGGMTRNRIAALDASTGGALASWNPNANDLVGALMVAGDTVFAGGSFSSIAGESRGCLAGIWADGTVDPGTATEWNPGANAQILSLIFSPVGTGAYIYAGGAFTSMGGDSFPFFADFDEPGPEVSDIAPSWGVNDSAMGVRITGARFESGPSVKLKKSGQPNITATGVTASAGQIDCTFDLTDVKVGAWDLYVANPGGADDLLPDAFTVYYPDPPHITSITPNAASNAGPVDITDLAGTGFQPGAQVRLHKDGESDRVADNVNVVSVNQVTCTIDLTEAAVGAWDVYIENDDEQSDTVVGAFTVENVAPEVTGIDPDNGFVGEALSGVSVLGAHFRDVDMNVQLKRGGDTIEASGVEWVSSAEITCDIDLDSATAGAWDVVVTNQDDGKSGTLPGGFAVYQLAVTASVTGTGGMVSPFTQDIGYNDPASIAITPNAHYHIASITDNTTPVTPLVSPYTIAHVTEAHNVVVSFAVDAPTITSLSPTASGAGSTITITGTSFGSARNSSRVRFNTTTCASGDYVSWGNNQVRVKVPIGATSGNVTLTTSSGTSNTRPFTVTYPTWYLAEGSTAWGFSAYLTIENPNGSDLSANVTYMPTGSATVEETVTLPAQSQTTITNDHLLQAMGGEKDFSTRVVCPQGRTITVDRTMTWTGQGAASPEGHSSVGVTSPASTWYLPEGSSKWGFETWLLIQNPGARDADCTVTYMIEGQEPITVSHAVPGASRASFNMANDIGENDASIKVTSNVPVIPERAVYRNNRREGHESIGTTTPAKDFYLSEGTTAWGFTTYVLVQNPNPNPTDITVTYMTSTGARPQGSFTMPANSRKTIRVNDIEEMASTDFSTRVHGTGNIIAERAMYWNNGTGEASHDSIGMGQARATFYLPDGETSNGRETYTLVQNPNSTTVDVSISYLTPSGAGNVTFPASIPANSRQTFNMADNGINGRASVRVTCTTPRKNIIVERSMYWNTRGAGTDTIGGYSD